MARVAGIEFDEQGPVRLSGVLDFDSVPELWRQWQSRRPRQARVDIDLGGIERADSAGLALLIACMRQARQDGAALRFLNMPAQLLEIARLSSLDDILPL